MTPSRFGNDAFATRYDTVEDRYRRFVWTQFYPYRIAMRSFTTRRSRPTADWPAAIPRRHCCRPLIGPPHPTAEGDWMSINCWPFIGPPYSRDKSILARRTLGSGYQKGDWTATKGIHPLNNPPHSTTKRKLDGKQPLPAVD